MKTSVKGVESDGKRDWHSEKIEDATWCKVMKRILPPSPAATLFVLRTFSWDSGHNPGGTV